MGMGRFSLADLPEDLNRLGRQIHERHWAATSAKSPKFSLPEICQPKAMPKALRPKRKGGHSAL